MRANQADTTRRKQNEFTQLLVKSKPQLNKDHLDRQQTCQSRSNVKNKGIASCRSIRAFVHQRTG